ncbi:DMT family transporter [Tatumella ptyseos]|uniref:DMT family transporter n=1 Tax=Tatumella ptyseos TaxID=82987 RepID=UPI0026F26AC9|nr:multidrug efflux SMR transporter [Tatumella ptyseos]WKX26933.1 multidrug efflux SMR transporter [Tatumella ptyseos]
MTVISAYFALALAIILEVAATTFLGKSEGFTKLIPTLVSGLFYAGSFYVLSQVIRVIPLGVAYASWAGVGIVLTTIIGIYFFKQLPDVIAVVGITLIVVGVVLINGFSKTNFH